MKKIHLFIILITSLLLQGCIHEPVPKHVQIANKIMGKVAKGLYEKHGLKLIVTGGSMMHEIKIIHLSFTSTKSLSIEEARKFILECSKIFLDYINNFPEIKLYLNNYPATEKNIELSIFFGINGIEPISPYVSFVSTSSSDIRYYIKKNNEETKRVLIETYQEALQKAGMK